MKYISKNRHITKTRHRRKTRKTTKCGRKINGHIIAKKEGWIIAQIHGEPYERGFAHGYLLHKELVNIDKLLKFTIRNQYGKNTDYAKYSAACSKYIVPVLLRDFPEYYAEIEGISAGAKSAGVSISVKLLIEWNATSSMYSYFMDGDSSKESQRCSAFIATGDATKKGDIVMAHNTHCDFPLAATFNIVLYVKPATGMQFVMQTAAGLVMSMTDWFICGSGIIGCETTMSEIKYKPQFGYPHFCRIRKAMQYGKTLDDYVAIMKDHNAGDYACSWLFGDINNNEIMLCELGLKESNIKRTHNGVFYGMNTALGKKLRETETNDTDLDDLASSSGARNTRFKEIFSTTEGKKSVSLYGKITAENAQIIISDHYDSYLKIDCMNNRGICRHSELDATQPSEGTPAYYPWGATDGKVVDTTQAKRMEFMGRFGSACGREFIAKDFLEKHPDYKGWKEFMPDFLHTDWVKICV